MLLTKTPLALENYTLTECVHLHSRNNDNRTPYIISHDLASSMSQ